EELRAAAGAEGRDSKPRIFWALCVIVSLEAHLETETSRLILERLEDNRESEIIRRLAATVLARQPAYMDCSDPRSSDIQRICAVNLRSLIERLQFDKYAEYAHNTSVCLNHRYSRRSGDLLTR